MKKALTLTALSLMISTTALAQGASLSYLGPLGTYSDTVAQAAAKDFGIKATLATSITDVSNQVSSGQSAYGLIPIRNSSGGYVAETQGLLGKTPAWRIVGVYQLAIDNVLMAKAGTNIKDIKTIVSHPQPFLQSAGYLKTNFPDFKKVEVKSTAAAAEQVSKDGDRTTAAIAAPAAAPLYGLTVLASGIQDDKLNTTRFLVVQSGEIADGATGTDVELSFLSTRDDRGATRSRLMVSALSRLGLSVNSVLETPTGNIDNERLTIFASGRSNDAASIRRALTGSGATLIGLHGAPINVGAAASSKAITSVCPGYNPLQTAGTRLAALASCRLDVALLVAQSKYNSGAAIEDVVREQAVIDAALKTAPQIPASVVQDFWRGQIEGSKIAQRALISSWTTQKQAKFNPAPDLVKEVRPLLDAIGAQINQDLAEAWAQRSCDVNIPSGSIATLPSEYSSARTAVLKPISAMCR